MPDLTRTRASDSARRALDMAELRLVDVDTVHVYDAFTISLLILLEDLGFCAKGTAGTRSHRVTRPWHGHDAGRPRDGCASNDAG